jgi:hypothetical protein
MLAEYLRRSTGERLENNQQVAIDAGRWPVRLIPGLRQGKRGPELDPKKVEAVREAVRMRLAGASIEDVRLHLGANGVSRSHSGTTHLLHSRQLIGEIKFRDRVARIPEIISDDDFRHLQKISVARGPKPTSDRLLARLGVLRCATCNSRMVVGTSHEGATWCYRCPPFGDECAKRMSISAPIVEGEVEGWIRQQLAGVKQRATNGSVVAEAKAELERSQTALDSAVASLGASDLLSEPASIDRLRELRDRRNDAQDVYDDALDADRSLSVVMSAGDWDSLTLDERRDLVRALIKRVRIHPGRGAERIEIEPRD